MINLLWSLLSDKRILFFGTECRSAIIVMLTSLFIRAFLHLARLQSFVPYGVIFAFPPTFKALAECFPLSMVAPNPLLNIRVAEALLGRIESHLFLLMLIAHFTGSLFGAIIYISMVPNGTLLPILYPTTTQFEVLLSLLLETFVNCMYCLIIIAVPELLSINKLPWRYLSLILLPVMFIGTPQMTSTFNPTGVFATWCIGSNKLNELQIEHIVGPLLGGYIAGCISLRLFPDDPSCWKKVENMNKRY